MTILALLDDVAAGDEVEITKHGRVVAQLVPRPAVRTGSEGRSLVPRGAQRATTTPASGPRLPLPPPGHRPVTAVAVLN